MKRLVIASFILIVSCTGLEGFANAWDAKEALALFCALMTFALHIRHTPIKPLNFGVCLVVGYLLLHPLITPPLISSNPAYTAIFDLALYKPLAQLLIYFLFFLAVSSADFSKRDIKNIINTFCLTAIILSLYCFLQFFQLDQFHTLITTGNAPKTDGKLITATLGHPNQCGIFIASLLPFVLLRSKKATIIPTIAILLSQSMLAYGGAVIAFAGYLFFRGTRAHRVLLIALGLLGSFVAVIAISKYPFLSSGRLTIWSSAWDLLIHNPHGQPRLITGYGMGTFVFLVGGTLEHPSRYMQNDALQFLFANGLIGLGGLIFLFICLLKKAIPFIMGHKEAMVFMLSFLILLACSFGSFVFQVEPHRFFSVFLLGYLFNLTRGKQNA
jgi:O-antigen ligase